MARRPLAQLVDYAGPRPAGCSRLRARGLAGARAQAHTPTPSRTREVRTIALMACEVGQGGVFHVEHTPVGRRRAPGRPTSPYNVAL